METVAGTMDDESTFDPRFVIQDPGTSKRKIFVRSSTCSRISFTKTWVPGDVMLLLSSVISWNSFWSSRKRMKIKKHELQKPELHQQLRNDLWLVEFLFRFLG